MRRWYGNTTVTIVVLNRLMLQGWWEQGDSESFLPYFILWTSARLCVSQAATPHTCCQSCWVVGLSPDLESLQIAIFCYLFSSAHIFSWDFLPRKYSLCVPYLLGIKIETDNDQTLVNCPLLPFNAFYFSRIYQLWVGFWFAAFTFAWTW